MSAVEDNLRTVCLFTEGRACSLHYKNSNVVIEVREFNLRPTLHTVLDSILGAATIIVSALIAGQISNAEVSYVNK